jgi:hypothetical protein
MSKVKIEKDVFVRDQWGIRVRMFVAGTEVDEHKYNEAFRLNVPVNPEDLPKTPEFVGTESLNGAILPENKMLFDEVKEDEKKAEIKKEKEVEPVVEEEVEDEKEKKSAKAEPAKAKK